jgi:cobyrinic acid a,c-diamide synthase
LSDSTCACPAGLHIAYVEIETTGGLFGPGQKARGHMFHHSRIDGEPDMSRCYRLRTARGEETQEGYETDNVLASYAHLQFASAPALAQSFVERCAASRRLPGRAHR